MNEAEMTERYSAELAELHAQREAKPLTPQQIKEIRAALLAPTKASR
jgi:hypothetical protein